MTFLRATFSSLAAAALLIACREPPQQKAQRSVEVQLASDMPDAVVDTTLRLIEKNGGPHAERIAGQRADVSALPGAAGAPVDGGAPVPVPAAAGDVRWDTDPYGAIGASARGQLAPGPMNGKDVPPLWRDPAGSWVAVGGRAEVLLIAIDELGDHGAPVRYAALTEPWLKGRVAVAAPTSGMSLAHFAALYQAWGEERMRAWLDGLKANAVQVLDSDDAVRQAVVSGKAIVGILSSDEAAKAAASAAHVLPVYPNQRSIGTFVWPTALSISKSAKNMATANELAERLSERSTEQLLVARVPGYLPLRHEIPVPPGVRSAANLVVVSVDLARIVEEIGRRKVELATWTQQLSRTAAPAPQVQGR